MYLGISSQIWYRDKIDAPFFNAKDVSKILGYSEMNKALREHIDKDEKKPLSGATAKSPSIHNEGKPSIFLNQVYTAWY